MRPTAKEHRMIQVEVSFRDDKAKKVHLCPDETEEKMWNQLSDQQRGLFFVVGDADFHTHFYATDTIKAVHIKHA